MIFPVEEYNAGASLHVSSVPASQHIQHTFNEERERHNPLNFEIQNFNKCCKDFNARPHFVQVVVEVSFNGYLQLSPYQSGLRQPFYVM
jgi:hypothetical protein